MTAFTFSAPAPNLDMTQAEFDAACEQLVEDLAPAVAWMNETATAAEAAKVDAQTAAATTIAASAYKGAYNAGTTYQIGDSVLQGGFVWQANTVNTGVTPVDGVNWRRVIQLPNPSTQNYKFLQSDGSATPVWGEPHPIGALMASYAQPAGWLPADGAVVLQSAYPALYSAIGHPPGASTAAQRLDTVPVGSVLPGNPNGGAWSPNGQYLAICHATTPFVTICRRTGDELVPVPAPTVPPASTGQGAAWSPDSAYLAVAHDSTPFVTIYKRNGNAFTKLPDPATLPAGNGTDAAWSSDGVYLAISHGTSPYVTIYKRSGDTFTKLSNPATLPGGTVTCVAFSPDTTYLAMGSSVSPYVLIYKRSGDTFTKLADPGTLPTGAVAAPGGVAWSGANGYLAVAHATSPFVTVYSRSGDTFTKMNNPATLPAGTGQGAALSVDEKYLFVAHASTPFISGYSRSGTVWTKLTNPTDLPTQDSTFLAMGGALLAVGSSVGAGVGIYRALGYDTATEFSLPIADLAGHALTQRAAAAMRTFIRAL